MATVTPGIEELLRNRAEMRKKLHKETVAFWDAAAPAFDKLGKQIAKPVADLRCRTLTIPDHVASIAFLGDVHANLPALEAVIHDAKSRGTGMFLYAGDMTGYGPFPKETLAYTRTCVLGNAEEDILAAGNTGGGRDKKRTASHRKTWMRLDPLQRKELAAMPAELRFVWGGKRYAVMHHPEFPEKVCPETPAADLERLVLETDADVVICAHTHRSFAKDVHGTLVLNTGSVGRPGDGDLRACYLLITKEPFAVHHIRVPYDPEPVLAGLKKHLRVMFAYGLDFDEAVKAEKTGEYPEVRMPDTVTVEVFPGGGE
jgi:putative phosphoesterase